MLAETYYTCEKIDITSNGNIIKKNEKFKIVGSFEGFTTLEIINKYGEKRLEPVYDSDLIILEKSGFITRTEYNLNDYLKKEFKFNIGDMVAGKYSKIGGIIEKAKFRCGENKYDIWNFDDGEVFTLDDIPEHELELVKDGVLTYDFEIGDNKFTATISKK